jgi:hypothetical protein
LMQNLTRDGCKNKYEVRKPATFYPTALLLGGDAL